MKPACLAIWIVAATAQAAEIGPQAGSSTVAGEGTSKFQMAKIRVTQLDLGAEQQASFIVPDGDGRIVVENEILSAVIRVGTNYNFFNGRIKAWITYVMPLVGPKLKLHVGALDEVGLGRLYRFPNEEGRRYFERTQSVPLGLACVTPLGALALSASRVHWRYGPLDIPQQTERSRIDSISLELNANRDIPDIAEGKVHEETMVRFQHAFPDWDGQYRFDKVEADVFWRIPFSRRHDSWRVRTFIGQAYNADPGLPLREKYPLGGATTLKGYQYEEFLGDGLLLLGSEYSLGIPANFSWTRARMALKTLSLLAFFEGGRIQNKWFIDPDPWKVGFGFGLKLDGTALGGRESAVRLYLAQAGEIRKRSPVFYFLIGIK